MRAKLFVDFWNFQLDWNHLFGKSPSGRPIQIPWESKLPQVILGEVSKKEGTTIKYDGARVYASVDPMS